MTDELTAVRSVLSGVDGPSDQAWAQARAALMEEIEGVSRSGAVRRRRRWVPAMGAVSALVAAGAVVLATQVFVRGGAVQPSSAAAAVLRRAADAALASPPARLKAGQYWYEAYHATYLNMVGTRHGVVYAYVPQEMRYWIGSRRWIRRDTPGRVRPTRPITQPWQRRTLHLFGPNPSLSGRGSGFDVPISYAHMRSAPTTTRALARWVLRAEVAPGFTPKPRYRPQIMFTTISDILSEPMVPARLQAGLYRVAATIPGIQMLGRRRDTLGRIGLAVAFVGNGSPLNNNRGLGNELLFDPTSYALLDYDQTIRHRSGGLPVGTITQETAFQAAGLVHRIGQRIRPAGG